VILVGKEYVFPLDFMDIEECGGIIKKSLTENLKVESEDRKDFAHHFLLVEKRRVIVYWDNKGHLTIDLNQCHGKKQEVYNLLFDPLSLNECKIGKKRTPKWKLYNPDASRKLKERLMNEFPKKLISAGTSLDQYFVLKIKGKNTLVHMKNGELTLLTPYPNEVTDKICTFVENFLETDTEITKINLNEVMVKKLTYSDFAKRNADMSLWKHISPDVYDFLSGRDIAEIDDGLKLFSLVKEKNHR